ncbi:MAG TPA: hypothetical protein VL689_10250 [Paraburkholderia sp.]|jgi:hypothetical protein|nr:hypothetical protein [Paraburkholderia sp.]
MKRLLAILAFVAGGFAAELAHPAACRLIDANSRAYEKRQKR